MAKLRKEKIDAVLADHARGYTVVEIAERTGVHRNTVAKLLRPEEVKEEAPDPEAVRKAAIWAALCRVVVLIRCTKCSGQLPLVTHQPNLFWRDLACGHVLRCPCGTWNFCALPGMTGRLPYARAAFMAAEVNFRAGRL